MTVQIQNSVQYFAGPIEVGTTLSIVDFTFIDDSHVSVKIRNNPEVWRYGYDYDVYGAQTLERQITVWRRVEEGEVLAVYLDVPITQNIAPEEGGNFPASTNEFVLDKLTYISQMLYERVARSMQVSIDTEFDGTLPNLVPGKAIKINAAGTGLELSDLDPDQAVKEIQQYIKIAEAAADSAELYAKDAKDTVDNLHTTADEIYAACEHTEQVATEAVETINNAAEHRLNSKEIGALIESPAILTNTDLHKADGSVITENDDIHAQFHNVFMKKQRELTDIKTKYYKYNSYNYSRVWYSTVKSEPDRFYGLTDILNAPAGTWYLLDRSGTPIARPSIECKSYYKYELINAVGDAEPSQYILWPVQMGDAQRAEPETADYDDFYKFNTDERIGNKIDSITNIVVLPPDVTSEFRRIQITRVVGANTYYYYYKATPIEIHAYVNGTVAELNLAANAGVQTDATVIKPYLLTTHQGIFEKITNPEFFTTKEWFEAKEGTEDYNKIYTSLDSDLSYDIVNLHDEVVCVGQPTNRLGVFSGFTANDYLKITKPLPTHTTYEGEVVRTPIEKFEAEIFFKTPAVDLATSNCAAVIGRIVDVNGMWFARHGASDSVTPKYMKWALYANADKSLLFELKSKAALLDNTTYKAKLVFDTFDLIKTTVGHLVDYCPEVYTNKDTVLYTVGGTEEAPTYTKYSFPDLYKLIDAEYNDYVEYSLDSYFKEYLENDALYIWDEKEEIYVKYTRPTLYLLHENGEYSVYAKNPEITTKRYVRFYLAQSADSLILPIEEANLDIYQYQLQAEAEFDVTRFTQNLQKEFRLGRDAGWTDSVYWYGAIDLVNSYIKINDQLWWGNKVVPYAVKDGEYITMYASPKEQLYHREVASNVYETNPIGYTAGGAGVDCDGWWMPSAASQGVSLGTGVNTQWIDYRNDNFIDIQGRFITPALEVAYAAFVLTKAAYNYSGVIYVEHTATKEAVLHLGQASSSANTYGVSPISTGTYLKNNTEYAMQLLADFNTKYSLIDNEYIEAKDGTLYKYTFSLREWKAPLDDAEPQVFTFYNSYRFGSAAAEVYRVSGIGNRSFTAGENKAINYYSVTVNGRPLFADNMHVIDRPKNATALPRIADKDTQTYVVVANGLTEDFVLASPKEAIDTYVATTVALSLQNFGEDLQETLQNSYAQYNKVMTDTYKQGIKSLQSASDAVRKSDLQRVECVVETYRNGTSWYRIWSDGWKEQGGYLAAAGTVEFLLEFQYPTYNVSLSPITSADPYVSNRTTTNMTITNAGCLWIARGY